MRRRMHARTNTRQTSTTATGTTQFVNPRGQRNLSRGALPSHGESQCIKPHQTAAGHPSWIMHFLYRPLTGGRRAIRVQAIDKPASRAKGGASRATKQRLAGPLAVVQHSLSVPKLVQRVDLRGEWVQRVQADATRKEARTLRRRTRDTLGLCVRHVAWAVIQIVAVGLEIREIRL